MTDTNDRPDIREEFSRAEMMFGREGMRRLKNARVAVFGVGGVGGYVVEALARSGVGAIDIIDKDTVSVTNINRQIVALHSTVGQLKTSVARKRILDIAPDCKVTEYPVFYLPENAGDFDFSKYDYVVDAVDSLTAKPEIVLRAQEAGVRVISCMGMGNRLDPTRLEVTDIYKTSICPIAREMRRLLRARGVKKLRCVYSTEQPIRPRESGEQLPEGKRSIPSSNAFVPPTAGLIIAGEVVRAIAFGEKSHGKDTF